MDRGRHPLNGRRGAGRLHHRELGSSPWGSAGLAATVLRAARRGTRQRGQDGDRVSSRRPPRAGAVDRPRCARAPCIEAPVPRRSGSSSVGAGSRGLAGPDVEGARGGRAGQEPRRRATSPPGERPEPGRRSGTYQGSRSGEDLLRSTAYPICAKTSSRAGPPLGASGGNQPAAGQLPRLSRSTSTGASPVSARCRTPCWAVPRGRAPSSDRFLASAAMTTPQPSGSCCRPTSPRADTPHAPGRRMPLISQGRRGGHWSRADAGDPGDGPRPTRRHPVGRRQRAQLPAARNCSTTSALMRPRALTSMPCPAAHARTAAGSYPA
ncbi:hypothetical protein SAMN05660350_04837 [Geodermatophilus obscurus]|uniref:Uncharacterized protein n=1 Tax=Geodermatophilus obscurus TaxID=1861 RepID=A0A1M7V0X6_9ACTN|nr:hypothetical protein SAMN05660350_04837 [Geodermatophilus obscurus]